MNARLLKLVVAMNTSTQILPSPLAAFVRCGVLRFALLSLATVAWPDALRAQAPGNPPAERTPSAQRWQELAVTRQLLPNADRYKDKTEAERVTVQAAEVAEYVARADRLAAFQAEFPDSTQAREAKRYEAMNILLAAQAGDKAHEGLWKEVVNAVRRDAAVPAADRYAVAAQADYLLVSRQGGLTPAQRIEACVRVARSHTAEYPAEPGGYAALLALARSHPLPAARALAEEVAGMPAPAPIKAQATRLVERFDMVGKKVDRILADAGVEGLRTANQPLVIYTWATWSKGSLELAEKLKAAAGGATLAGLCLDRDVEAAKAVAAEIRLPGSQTYDAEGTGGALAQALKLDDTGWVYLIDRSGAVVTVRGQDDLKAIAQL